jgi:hypothetical protein
MNTVDAALMALLLVVPPVAAQTSLEADLREAAAAYERKDMATAAHLWKLAEKGNAEACAPCWAPCTGAARACRATMAKRRALSVGGQLQGYARAQNDIGFMLGFGEGVPPRDDIEAYNGCRSPSSTIRRATRTARAGEEGSRQPCRAHGPGRDRRGRTAGESLEARTVAARQNYAGIALSSEGAGGRDDFGAKSEISGGAMASGWGRSRLLC